MEKEWFLLKDWLLTSAGPFCQSQAHTVAHKSPICVFFCGPWTKHNKAQLSRDGEVATHPISKLHLQTLSRAARQFHSCFKFLWVGYVQDFSAKPHFQILQFLVPKDLHEVSLGILPWVFGCMFCSGCWWSSSHTLCAIGSIWLPFWDMLFRTFSLNSFFMSTFSW